MPKSATTHADTPDRDSTDDVIADEVRETVEEAADRLEGEDEPLTVSRLAGTTLQLGIDTDTHRFTTIADACRAVIDDRADTDVETEVTR